MTERKVIFEATIGSHLYGINKPDSDLDYGGVFLPSTEDLIGMEGRPAEWKLSEKKSDGPRNTKGDIDRIWYALYTFLKEAGAGQSQKLEFLFAPPHLVQIHTGEWATITDHREYFMSRKGIAPFIGFALGQAHKATVKGDNLRKIRGLILQIGKLTQAEQKQPLKDYFVELSNPTQDVTRGFTTNRDESSYIRLFNHAVPRFTNEYGADLIEIAGRDYDVGSKVKDFLYSLNELVAKYGTRVKDAAEFMYDYKSLTHCYRLLMEAEEFLKTGHITLPRPSSDVDFLMRIRRKEWPTSDIDVFKDINDRIDYIRNDVEPKSPLPPMPNWKGINKLCSRLQAEHLGIKLEG